MGDKKFHFWWEHPNVFLLVKYILITWPRCHKSFIKGYQKPHMRRAASVLKNACLFLRFSRYTEEISSNGQYRISSNKRPGAYLGSKLYQSPTLIGGRLLKEKDTCFKVRWIIQVRFQNVLVFPFQNAMINYH